MSVPLPHMDKTQGAQVTFNKGSRGRTEAAVIATLINMTLGTGWI